jgi:hypothetical protein
MFSPRNQRINPNSKCQTKSKIPSHLSALTGKSGGIGSPPYFAYHFASDPETKRIWTGALARVELLFVFHFEYLTSPDFLPPDSLHVSLIGTPSIAPPSVTFASAPATTPSLANLKALVY